MNIRVTFTADVTSFEPRMDAITFSEIVHKALMETLMRKLHVGTRRENRLDAPSKDLIVDWNGSINGNTEINRIDDTSVEDTYEEIDESTTA